MNVRLRTRSLLAGLLGVLVLFGISHPACAQDAQPPTFTRDILPLMQEHCQECHRPGQVGPMSFMSYEEARPWAKSIRKVVNSRTMPPFHAAGPLGTFKNDLRLTDEQIDAIVTWVDRGAPRGRPDDAPEPREWQAGQWELEEPDLILEYPGYTVQENMNDDFVMFFSDYQFPQDTWLEAIEFRPRDHRFVHHAGIFAISDKLPMPKSRVWSSNAESFESQSASRDGMTFQSATAHLMTENFLFTWLPGYGPERRLSGQAIKIHAGESLLVQSHFGPSQETGDGGFSVAVNFYSGEVSHSLHKYVALMLDLEIPPGESTFEFRQRIKVREDSRVYAYNTHMHLRGRSSRFILHLPDMTTQTLFDVPNYSFDWQRVYFLTKPVQLPAGAILEYIATWDNSADNPLNPDPTQTVVWGPKTTDEMYSGSVYYTKELDQPIRVQDGLIVNSN